MNDIPYLKMNDTPPKPEHILSSDETSQATVNSFSTNVRQESHISPTRECDYDNDATKLFKCIEESRFDEAINILNTSSQNKAGELSGKEQANTWTVRREGNGDIRWRMLPIHASIIYGAPPNLIEAIISAAPNSLKCKDDLGQLPLHIAFRKSEEKGISLLLKACPECFYMKDNKGRLPIQLTPNKLSQAPEAYVKMIKSNDSFNRHVRAIEEMKPKIDIPVHEESETNKADEKKNIESSHVDILPASSIRKTSTSITINTKQKDIVERLHEKINKVQKTTLKKVSFAGSKNKLNDEIIMKRDQDDETEHDSKKVISSLEENIQELNVILNSREQQQTETLRVGINLPVRERQKQNNNSLFLDNESFKHENKEYISILEDQVKQLCNKLSLKERQQKVMSETISQLKEDSASTEKKNEELIREMASLKKNGEILNKGDSSFLMMYEKNKELRNEMTCIREAHAKDEKRHNEDRSKLQLEIEHLQKVLNTKEQEKLIYCNGLKKASNSIRLLHDKNKELNKKITVLDEEKDKEKKTIDLDIGDMQEKITLKEKEFTAASERHLSELNKANSTIEKLQNENDKLTTKLATLKKEHDDTLNHITQLHKENKEKTAALQADVRELNIMLSLKNKVDACNKDKKLKAVDKKSNEDMDALRKTNQELIERLSALEEEQSASKKSDERKIKALQKEIIDLRGKSSSHEKEQLHRAMSSRLATIEEEYEDQVEELLLLKKENERTISNLDSETKELKNELISKDEKCKEGARAAAELERMRRGVATLCQSIDNLLDKESLFGELQSDKMTTSSNSSQEKGGSHNGSSSSQTSSNFRMKIDRFGAKLTEKLERDDKLIQRLQATMKKQMKQLEAAQEQHSKDLRELQSIKNEVNGTMATSAGLIKQLNDKLVSKDNECEASAKKINDLLQKNSIIPTLRKEKDDLEEKLSLIKDEYFTALQEFATVREENEVNTSKLSTIERNHDSALKKIAGLEKTTNNFPALKKVVYELSAELQKRETEVANANRDASSVQQTNQNLRQAMDRVQQAYVNVLKSRDEWKHLATSWKTELLNQHSMLYETKTCLEALELTVTKQREDIRAYKKEKIEMIETFISRPLSVDEIAEIEGDNDECDDDEEKKETKIHIDTSKVMKELNKSLSNASMVLSAASDITMENTAVTPITTNSSVWMLPVLHENNENIDDHDATDHNTDPPLLSPPSLVVAPITGNTDDADPTTKHSTKNENKLPKHIKNDSTKQPSTSDGVGDGDGLSLKPPIHPTTTIKKKIINNAAVNNNNNNNNSSSSSNNNNDINIKNNQQQRQQSKKKVPLPHQTKLLKEIKRAGSEVTAEQLDKVVAADLAAMEASSSISSREKSTGLQKKVMRFKLGFPLNRKKT